MTDGKRKTQPSSVTGGFVYIKKKKNTADFNFVPKNEVAQLMPDTAFGSRCRISLLSIKSKLIQFLWYVSHFLF